MPRKQVDNPSDIVPPSSDLGFVQLQAMMNEAFIILHDQGLDPNDQKLLCCLMLAFARGAMWQRDRGT